MSVTVTRRYFKELRFQQLQSYCEAVKRLSFADAADALGLSRPALWHQIRALERELGANLIRRKGRGIEITDDGRRLFDLASPLVAGFDSLQSTFRGEENTLLSRLAIVSTDGLLANELKKPIGEFCQRYPQVRLTVAARTSLEALRMVDAGEVDLAVCGTFLDEPLMPSLQYEQLFHTPLVLICPREHELVGRQRLRLDRLILYPFVLLTRDSITRQRIERVFGGRGLLDQLNVVLDGSSDAMVLDYVAQGLGITILGSTKDHARRELHSIPVSQWFGHETTVMAHRRGRIAPPQVQQFTELVRSTMQRTSPTR